MDNKVINKKIEITTIIKKFKELLELYSDKLTEKQLILSKKCIKRNENLVNDEDETDIEYITDEFSSIERVFKGFCSICSIDYTPETVNESTFIETPDRIKNKKCTINPQNSDNKCFQYSVTLSLYHKQVGRNLFRVSKIKPFINNINWKNINFPPQEQDYKTLEMNSKSIALNVLTILDNEKIGQYYKSEHNKTRENKVILLMLSDNNKQNAEHSSHYLFAKIKCFIKKRICLF